MNLNARGCRDITRGDNTGAVLAEAHRDGLIVLARNHNRLDVQDDFGHVFLGTGDGAEGVLHAVETDAGNCGAGNRREQGTAE